MDNRPIGVFDSGLGGLTAVKELLEIMPQEDIVYFGDTGRVPYGSRSQETLIKYAAQDIHFLEEKQVKMIVTEYRQLHEYHFHYITYQIINTAKKGLSLRKVLFI